jgi:hypothetical protein
LWQSEEMASTPTRPDTKLEAETEETVRERLATVDKDRANAKPWPEVMAQILLQPKPR